MNSYTAKDCDTAYRRGFDQAIAFLMQDCGLSQAQINSFKYKETVAQWRAGAGGFTRDLRNDAPRMNRDEARQFVSFLNSAFWNEQGGLSDA